MNYKKKWKGQLLKMLRERGEVRLETRDSREMGYITELEEEGKITVSRVGGGLICRLKGSAEEKPLA